MKKAILKAVFLLAFSCLAFGQDRQRTPEEIGVAVRTHSIKCDPTTTVFFEELTKLEQIEICRALEKTKEFFLSTLNLEEEGDPPLEADRPQGGIKPLEIYIFNTFQDYEDCGTCIDPQLNLNITRSAIYFTSSNVAYIATSEFYEDENEFFNKNRFYGTEDSDIGIDFLLHEYIHYLDDLFVLSSRRRARFIRSRFLLPTWWVEGIAEYMSKPNRTSAFNVARIIDSNNCSLEEIFSSDYFQSRCNPYHWGYLLIHYLFEENRNIIDHLVHLFRTGDDDDVLSYLLSLQETDLEQNFLDWLLNLQDIRVETENTIPDTFSIETNSFVNPSEFVRPGGGIEAFLQLDEKGVTLRWNPPLRGGYYKLWIKVRHATSPLFHSARQGEVVIGFETFNLKGLEFLEGYFTHYDSNRRAVEEFPAFHIDLSRLYTRVEQALNQEFLCEERKLPLLIDLGGLNHLIVNFRLIQEDPPQVQVDLENVYGQFYASNVARQGVARPVSLDGALGIEVDSLKIDCAEGSNRMTMKLIDEENLIFEVVMFEPLM